MQTYFITNNDDGSYKKPSLNSMNKVTKFLKEARAELKKVSWPTREEVTNSTIVVIISVILVSIFLGIFDKIITEIVRLVIK